MDAVVDRIAILTDTGYEDLVKTIAAVSAALSGAAGEITETGCTGKGGSCRTGEALGGFIVDAGHTGGLTTEDTDSV